MTFWSFHIPFLDFILQYVLPFPFTCPQPSTNFPIYLLPNLSVLTLTKNFLSSCFSISVPSHLGLLPGASVLQIFNVLLPSLSNLLLPSLPVLLFPSLPVLLFFSLSVLLFSSLPLVLFL